MFDNIHKAAPWLPDGNPRSRLFRKYAVYLAAVVCIAILAGGFSGIYSTQRELRAQLAALQKEKALSAANKVEEFIRGIQQQLHWLTLFPVARDSEALRVDSARLLKQVPAISHVRIVDAAGRERLFASQFEVDRSESGFDVSDAQEFRVAKAGQVYFSPIYFRRETEPYMTLAEPETRPNGGVVIAEVNLKAIWDVVSAIRIGESGYAYIVDDLGTLVAHRDISLVLRKMNLRSLPQVAAALAPPGPGDSAPVSRVNLAGVNSNGVEVVSTAMRVAAPAWFVFVEQPLREADAPINSALLGTAALLSAGLLLSLVVSFRFARRMVRPIEVLRSGAARLGSGALGHRIDLESGDELEMLARQFNAMAERLQESYATLERKIEERTLELALANRTKTRFLAAASHDLRQPVHALGLLLSGIRGKTDPVELQAMIDRAGTAIEAITELLDSLLDISKLDAGIERSNPQDFSLDAVFERIAFDFNAEAADKDLELRIVRSTRAVHSDPLMLTRILLNLVSNAIRHTRRGAVLLGCRRRGAMVRIEVWDTGPGIPSDQQAAVFQEFFRADAVALDRPRGLGLGLSIVSRLATLLGVEVELRSTVGKGSMFAVSVPAGRVAQPLSPPAPANPGDDLAGRRVLVIDDDPMVVEAMQHLLTGWGCEVTAVRSGEAAPGRIAFDGRHPDIIICDYDLRETATGIDVLNRLIGQAPGLVAGVLVTGDTTPQVLRIAEAAGYPVLHKPVRPAKLRSILAYAVRPRAQPAAVKAAI